MEEKLVDGTKKYVVECSATMLGLYKMEYEGEAVSLEDLVSEAEKDREQDKKYELAEEIPEVTDEEEVTKTPIISHLIKENSGFILYAFIFVLVLSLLNYVFYRISRAEKNERPDEEQLIERPPHFHSRPLKGFCAK